MGAVEWLCQYIRSLKCTVCVVSHDYEFLDEILTDCIHICDSKLTYYPGSFSNFQRLRPEIVAGLPSPANAVARAKAALGAPPASPAAAGAPPPPANGAAPAAADGANGAAADAAAPPPPPAPAAPEAAIKTIEPLNFPDPGPLDGIRSRVKTARALRS